MSVESVCWRMQVMIAAHLTDARVLAVCVTIQLALEAVILNFSRGLT